MPSITKETYSHEHQNLSNVVNDIVSEEIKMAGLEEKEFAEQKGDTDENGLSCITVIADGAWCKRSYKTNYDALSGVGCIIGEATRKVLFMGVRNKYCVICNRAENKNQTPKPHICFRNWKNTSTSMEANIIVEGFQTSIDSHGLKYTRLIGDGDSSVTRKIHEIKPYGCTLVEKIECANHLLRNVCSKLKELVRSPRSSIQKRVPIKLRKQLESNILKFRIAIKKSAEYRFLENTPYSEKIILFKQDVLNSPDHIFGEHKNCASYFCQGAKDGEINLVPELIECGLRNDIIRCLQRITANASSCLLNKNNNSAERFNSLICKFVGGKRVSLNFSLSTSFQLCHFCRLIFH